MLHYRGGFDPTTNQAHRRVTLRKTLAVQSYVGKSSLLQYERALLIGDKRVRTAVVAFNDD